MEADQTSNKVYWYENDGSPGDGTWTRTKIKGGLDGVYSVFVADMDNDGDMDVVSAVYVDDDIRWHENDGTPSGINSWKIHFQPLYGSYFSVQCLLKFVHLGFRPPQVPTHHNLVIITLKDYRYNIFANVMNITLHGSKNNLSSFLSFSFRFLFHKRSQIGNGFLHHSCGFNHLR